MNGRLSRAFAVLAVVAAMALLAAAIAWWGWRAFGPAPVHVVPATPADPAAAILASGLLAGVGAVAVPPAAPAKEDGALATGLELSRNYRDLAHAAYREPYQEYLAEILPDFDKFDAEISAKAKEMCAWEHLPQ